MPPVSAFSMYDALSLLNLPEGALSWLMQYATVEPQVIQSRARVSMYGWCRRRLIEDRLPVHYTTNSTRHLSHTGSSTAGLTGRRREVAPLKHHMARRDTRRLFMGETRHHRYPVLCAPMSTQLSSARLGSRASPPWVGVGRSGADKTRAAASARQIGACPERTDESFR